MAPFFILLGWIPSGQTSYVSVYKVIPSAVNIILSPIFAYENPSNVKNIQIRNNLLIFNLNILYNFEMVKARAAFFLAIQKGIALTLPFVQIKVIHVKTLRIDYNFYICLSHNKIKLLAFPFIHSINKY